MSTTQEPYVFVSYAHTNIQVVQRLVFDLKAQGIHAWIDKSGLQAGTPDWENALRVALSGAKAVILIASPDARASRFVRDELRIADMYKRRLYLVWVAGTQWMDSVPMGLGGYQYIDARGANYNNAINELVTALSGNPLPTLQVPAPPPPSSTSSIYPQVIRSTPYQTTTHPPVPGKTRPGKGTWACLTGAVATIAVIVVLVILVAGPLTTFFSSLIQNVGGYTPGSPGSGHLSVTPLNFTITHTQGGFSNGCFYTPGSGWTCRVTLQNTSTTGQFSWSTSVSVSTITLGPSAAIVPLSAGQNTIAEIQIPETSCTHAVVTFKGPENSVDVTINCS